MSDTVDTVAASEPTVTPESSAPAVEQAADGGVGQGVNTDATEVGLVGDEPQAEQTEVPESYSTDGLTVAEDEELDMPTVEALSGVAKELGLSQESFNKLYNTMMPILGERQEAQLTELRAEFIRDAKADPDMGGHRWNETLSTARKALFKFTDEPTRNLLQASGLDCHPGIIRAFLQIGRAMSDDAVIRGSQATTERDAAKAFFYNSQMN